MIEYYGLMGNTNSNLTNGGYVCEFGDSVLISMDSGLYILDKKTKEFEHIYNKPVKYINLSDDFIYFVDSKNTICEMSIMDSDIYKIVERVSPNYDEIYYLALIDEYIYYATFWGESVYRLNVIDGAEEFLFHSVGLNFAFDYDFLYYCDDQDGFIRRIAIDDIDMVTEMLPKDKTQMWLDYQDVSLEHTFDILNKGLDKKIEVNDIVLEEVIINDKIVYAIEFVDDWIYYAGSEYNFIYDSDEGDINIYRMDLEEFEEEMIVSDDVDCLNVVNGWIYYRNNSDEGALYVISIEGTFKRRLTDFPVGHVHIVEEWAYCKNQEDNDEFYKINVLTLETHKIKTFYGII